MEPLLSPGLRDRTGSNLAKGVLAGIGAFLGVLFCYLFVIIFLPVLPVTKQPIPGRAEGDDEGQERPQQRQDVEFPVGGSTVRGWLYLPEAAAGPVPCVVMSHGFAGTKDALLERYALRFVQAGLAAFTYDYRHFGESDGEPRQLFAMTYQLDDLRAAIGYARGRKEIDPARIALWGTSASGGYGLAIAAEDERIAAVIAQAAGIDHDADSKLYMERAGMGHFLRLFMHAQRDKGRSRFGLSPHLIPAVGRPGTLAMHNAPGAFEGYARLMRESRTFKNEICARALLMPHGPDAIKCSHKVHCPVLFLACENDNLVAPDSYRRSAEILGQRAEVRTYPIGHFDIYEGEWFQQAVAAQVDFLARHLGL